MTKVLFVDIKTFGNKAIIVNFEQRIDPEIHAKVMRLKNTIEQTILPGIQYYIPTYCSLTIGFDPSILAQKKLIEYIKTLPYPTDNTQEIISSRRLKIPVCYEPPFSLDLEEICRLTGNSPTKAIMLHTSTIYKVYMLGFLPGFAYMGALKKELECARKETPGRSVPAGAVGIAGLQTGIYPSQSPGGWQIIGRSPLSFFNPKAEQPFYFQVGDEVQFYAISKQQFLAY